MKKDYKTAGNIAILAWVATVLIIIALALLPKKCAAQPSCSKNSFTTRLVYAGRKYVGLDHSIGVTFQGVDNGFGLRYNQYLFNNIGLYTSAAKGVYWVYGSFSDIPHYKFALGLQYRVDQSSRVKIFFTAGGSYHEFWGNPRVDVYNGKVNRDENYYRLHHVSCEQGMGAEVGRFLTGFRVDFIRGEHNIDFALVF